MYYSTVIVTKSINQVDRDLRLCTNYLLSILRFRDTMALSTGASCILSSFMTLILMAGIQFFRNYLVSSKLSIVGAGYLGSILFLLLLTSISNLEMVAFGKHFQTKYTEVIFSLLISLFAVGIVHRIAVTTCFIFSIGTLYLLNRISTKVYQPTSTIAQSHSTVKSYNTKKRKN